MATDILITFFLVFMNGFFVAAEFAIVKVRASQLESKVKSGNASAKLAKNNVKESSAAAPAGELHHSAFA